MYCTCTVKCFLVFLVFPNDYLRNPLVVFSSTAQIGLTVLQYPISEDWSISFLQASLVWLMHCTMHICNHIGSIKDNLQSYQVRQLRLHQFFNCRFLNDTHDSAVLTLFYSICTLYVLCWTNITFSKFLLQPLLS